MKKLKLNNPFAKKSILSVGEKKQIIGGNFPPPYNDFPCMPKMFCRNTYQPCDRCALELPPAECDCIVMDSPPAHWA